MPFMLKNAHTGNIIPAIATTNAIVAGLIVTLAFSVLTDPTITTTCRNVYVCKEGKPNKALLDAQYLDKPNPSCYVCADKREVTVAVDFAAVTVACLQDDVLKKRLGMQKPDVEILDGRGVVLISSDEDDVDEQLMAKSLEHLQLKHGSRLRADDFELDYDIIINLVHLAEQESSDLKKEQEGETERVIFKVLEGNEAATAMDWKPDETKEIIVMAGKRKAEVNENEGNTGNEPKKMRVSM